MKFHDLQMLLDCCPEEVLPGPQHPQTQPLHVLLVETPSGPPGLSSTKGLQTDRPETRLQCLFTKHSEGLQGFLSSRPSATSGERGSPAHSQAQHTWYTHLWRLATRKSIQSGPASRESLVRQQEEFSLEGHQLREKGKLQKSFASL